MAPGLDPVTPSSERVLGGTELTALNDDTLTTYDVATNSYDARVAESLEPDALFVIWTLKLRDGITFGNGDPLTAQAVKTSIDRHFSSDNIDKSCARAANITQMTASDPKTLTFRLTDPWPEFPSSSRPTLG